MSGGCDAQPVCRTDSKACRALEHDAVRWRRDGNRSLGWIAAALTQRESGCAEPGFEDE